MGGTNINMIVSSKNNNNKKNDSWSAVGTPLSM